LPNVSKKVFSTVFAISRTKNVVSCVSRTY